VILSPGSSLRPPLAELKQATIQSRSSNLSTLEEVEREHVLRAVRESNWIIGGPTVRRHGWDETNDLGIPDTQAEYPVSSELTRHKRFGLNNGVDRTPLLSFVNVLALSPETRMQAVRIPLV